MNSPKEWTTAAANAAFWLVVKLTLFRLAIVAGLLAALVAFVHEANSNPEWITQLLGTTKR